MGIDSSTPLSSVALVTDGQVIEQAQVDPNKVSNQVLVMIDKILVSARTKLSDLDGFCLTVGPGSFTGLRIGASILKGLLLATSKPFVKIDTLESIALRAIPTNKKICTILDAKKTFIIVMKDFPNTDYALDSEFKVDLINDTLASKEMYIGRYYFEKKKWIPAINRFRKVIDDYETTIYTEEAIHRLVEIYYKIGLEGESQKYAQLLGYNYQSSRWYEASYKIFNREYKDRSIKKSKKEKEGIIKKFKKILDL